MANPPMKPPTSGGEPAPEAANAALPPSATFGRYRLLGRIGQGGMAEVYRALMTGPEGFERELVLKRILPRLSDAGDFKTMFIREAKISALLLHPNIVQIYEFGQAEGSYFIAMESVQGVTLREALTTLRREQRPMPHLVAADIARQICIGLDYAHSLSGPDGAPLEIVHQDVSPTNIMLAYNGTVKILDFGIARAASFAEEEAKKGLIKGKVSYLSPEQINLRPFDARADLFALGAVFHEMLTGRRLYQAKNDIARMRQLLEQPVAPPSALITTIPRELDRIVMRALEPEVTARYQSAADMASDLERTLIAARYSSRELSKLLHGLFLPDEDPLVVVDSHDVGHTATVTASGSSSGSGLAGVGTSLGSRLTSGSRLTPAPRPLGEDAGTSRPASFGDGAAESARAEVSRQPGAPDRGGAARLSHVLRAERGRLGRARLRARAQVLALAVVVAVAAGAAVWAGKRYLPGLLASPPPPPRAVSVTPASQLAPQPETASAPAPRPAKKHPPVHRKARGSAAAAPAASNGSPAPRGSALTKP